MWTPGSMLFGTKSLKMCVRACVCACVCVCVWNHCVKGWPVQSAYDGTFSASLLSVQDTSEVFQSWQWLVKKCYTCKLEPKRLFHWMPPATAGCLRANTVFWENAKCCVIELEQDLQKRTPSHFLVLGCTGLYQRADGLLTLFLSPSFPQLWCSPFISPQGMWCQVPFCLHLCLFQSGVQWSCFSGDATDSVGGARTTWWSHCSLHVWYRMLRAVRIK